MRWRRTPADPAGKITVAASAAPAPRKNKSSQERAPREERGNASLGLWGDGASRPMSGRTLRRLRLAPHRASTANLQALYPWQADAGVGALGPLVGSNMLGGGSFCFDPWAWYDKGLLTNPNGITFGEIGSRKSTEIKTRIARAYEFGRGTFATDVKSEYNGLADFLGHQPIFIGPGRSERLNPFDLGIGGNEDPADAQARQLTMLQALGAGVLRRDLTEAERTLCRIAVAELTGGSLERAISSGGVRTVKVRPGDRPRTPILPEVLESMLSPSTAFVEELPLTAGELRSQTADLVMAFARLVTGDLAGMFDGPTTVDVDPRGKLLIVNISSVLAERRDALPLVRICSSAWLQSVIASHRMRRYHISDEAWADMSVGTLRWYQSMFKLARQHWLSNWLVFHKPGDMLTAGDSESEMDRVAKGLIADAGTVAFYRQKPQQLELCRTMFGLTDAQTERLATLYPGQALWWTPERSFLVQHVRTQTEATFTVTDPKEAETQGTEETGPEQETEQDSSTVSVPDPAPASSESGPAPASATVETVS
ncbi:hypothetical protein [Streptomyces celluloflavus]|uniref:hypothetical protein n=1 Tax=Streptomyces celluloflavus TaxID=58344 RepID=UPI0036891E0B